MLQVEHALASIAYNIRKLLFMTWRFIGIQLIGRSPRAIGVYSLLDGVELYMGDPRFWKCPFSAVGWSAGPALRAIIAELRLDLSYTSGPSRKECRLV